MTRLKACDGIPLTHTFGGAWAQVTGLKACYAIPLTRQGHVVSVVVFYSRLSLLGARWLCMWAWHWRGSHHRGVPLGRGKVM